MKALSALRQAADDLNLASDHLGTRIVEIEAALAEIRAGVEAWTPISPEIEMGYCRVGNTWHLSVRVDETVTLLADAPRIVRVIAIERFPELVEALVRESEDLLSRLRRAYITADEFVAAMRSVQV